MKQPGVVIVTFNSAAEIGACLDAVVERCHEVVVVDNASEDGTVDELRRRPGIRLIANRVNRGFAAAANQGVTALDSDTVLLLNPDAVLLTSVEDLVSACSDPRVGAAAGKLVDGDGGPQRGFTVRRFPTPFTLVFEALGWNRLWPGNPVNRRYRCLDLDLEKPAEVEQPAGAFLLVRRDVWMAVGGLDEGFQPLWFEDVDLLLRIRNLGYSVRYVPSAAARHRGGHSLGKVPVGFSQLYWYASLLRYASKQFRRPGQALVCCAVAAGSLLRMLGDVLGRRSLTTAAAYARVMRLAGMCLLSGRISGVGARPLLTR